MADLEKQIDAVLQQATGTGAKLKCETLTPSMGKRILRAFKKWYASRGRRLKHYEADFEHGQWFLTDVDSGAQWMVVDAEGGDSIDGFDFEQVSEGSY